MNRRTHKKLQKLIPVRYGGVIRGNFQLKINGEMVSQFVNAKIVLPRKAIIK